MKLSAVLTLVAVLAASVLLHAEAVKDREGAVRSDRDKMGKDVRWIYNDIEQGFAEAKKSNKPLLDQFVCVRARDDWGIFRG